MSAKKLTVKDVIISELKAEPNVEKKLPKKDVSEREEGELVSESETENDETLPPINTPPKPCEGKFEVTVNSPCADDIIVLDVCEEDINLIEADEKHFYADYEEGEVVGNDLPDVAPMTVVRKHPLCQLDNAEVSQSNKRMFTLKEKFEQLDKLSNTASAECQALNKIFMDFKKNNILNTAEEPEDGEIQSPETSSTGETHVIESYETRDVDVDNKLVGYQPIEFATKYNSNNKAVIHVVNIGENELIITAKDVDCQQKNVEDDELNDKAEKKPNVVEQTDEQQTAAANVCIIESNSNNKKDNNKEEDNNNNNKNGLIKLNAENPVEKVLIDGNTNANAENVDAALANVCMQHECIKKPNANEPNNVVDVVGVIDDNASTVAVSLENVETNHQTVFDVPHIVEVGKIVNITAEGFNVNLNIGEQLNLETNNNKGSNDHGDVQLQTQSHDTEILRTTACPVYCIKILLQNVDEKEKNNGNGEFNFKLVEVVEFEHTNAVDKATTVDSKTSATVVNKPKTLANSSGDCTIKQNIKETTETSTDAAAATEPELTLPIFGPHWLFSSPKRIVLPRLNNTEQSPSPRLYRKERKLKIFSNRQKAHTHRPKPYDKSETNATKAESTNVRRNYRLPYCPYTTQARVPTHIPTLYDQYGRLRRNGADVCDCGNRFCEGCWYNCFECGSPKCGLSCRRNRQVYPDTWRLRPSRRTQQ